MTTHPTDQIPAKLRPIFRRIMKLSRKQRAEALDDIKQTLEEIFYYYEAQYD